VAFGPFCARRYEDYVLSPENMFMEIIVKPYARSKQGENSCKELRSFLTVIMRRCVLVQLTT